MPPSNKQQAAQEPARHKMRGGRVQAFPRAALQPPAPTLAESQSARFGPSQIRVRWRIPSNPLLEHAA